MIFQKMEAKPFNEQYESPIAKVFAIEIRGIICGSEDNEDNVENGGIETGTPDEI